MAERALGCGVGLVGLGVCLPEVVRTNDWWPAAWRARVSAGAAADFTTEAEARVATGGEEWLREAIRRWGADPFRGAFERRVIADDQVSSDLEVEACRRALACGGLGPESADLLIGYSQVPDDAGPANHGRVAGRLGLPLATASFTLEAGCASFLPQLTTAIRLVQSGDHRVALTYQSSAISRVTDYRTPASAGVGDGAVAQVVAAVPAGLGLVGRLQWTRGELCDGIVLGRADGVRRWYEAPRIPAPLVVTSHDPEAARRMGADGTTFAREACLALLERCGVRPDEVDFFACAQAAAWFGEACAAAIGLPPGCTTPPEAHFQRYGHLLAASAPLNLWVAWRAGRLRVGDLVLIYTPGVGFTQTATLLRWALPPPQ